MTKNISLLFLIIFSVLFTYCGEKKLSQEEIYINQIETSRLDRDKFWENAPNSIFLKASTKKFHPLEYFDVNPKFIYKSKFYKYPNEITTSFQYSKGRKGNSLRYGYFLIHHNNKKYQLNVYKTQPFNLNSHQDALEVRFKDQTTGKTTSNFGRLLNIYLVADTNFVYSIDFNLAYNQLCEYDSLTSRPIPLKEDSLDFSIEAGEKKFY